MTKTTLKKKKKKKKKEIHEKRDEEEATNNRTNNGTKQQRQHTPFVVLVVGYLWALFACCVVVLWNGAWSHARIICTSICFVLYATLLYAPIPSFMKTFLPTSLGYPIILCTYWYIYIYIYIYIAPQQRPARKPQNSVNAGRSLVEICWNNLAPSKPYARMQ